MPPLYIALTIGLLFFSSPPCTAAAAGGDTLAAGRALAVGDKLVSANGKFALGFFQFQHPSSQGTTTTSKSTGTTTTTYYGWYLGIWFHNIPDFTTVWVANRERPIADPDHKLAQLKISADGNLIVTISDNSSTTSTESTFWSTNIVIKNTTNSCTIHALLMNTGNLAILPESPSTSNRSVAPLWQSFDYPTDVGLPTAKIGWSKITGLNTSFVSRKSLIDPGLGSYSIELDTDGKLLLINRNPPSVTYWSWTPGKLDQLVQLLDALLEMDPRTKGLLKPGYVDNDEEKYFTYSLTDESASVFVPIDISGQLRLMLWSETAQSWQTIYAQPSDFCTPYAVCGPFTVCDGNSKGTSSSFFCSCMEGFSRKSPQDWDLGDLTGGCVRDTPLDCTTSNTNATSSPDVFQSIARVQLPYYPRSIKDAASQSECEKACLRDCSCTAYAFNSMGCSLWHSELLNVALADADNAFKDVLYLRLTSKDLQNPRGNNKVKPRVVVAASIVSSGLLMLLLLLLTIWRNRFRRCGVPQQSIQGSDGRRIAAFRYTEISHATKGFSERLGGGGFGSVFKGVLGDSTPIAVKRLDGARQGEKQFRAEVSSIGLIQHINLVKLIGFCCEGDKRLLVYEHMSNGSLEAHLFRSNSTVLDWKKRYQIAVGVGRGLCYLHQSCHECIIHCDIKPENILLDVLFLPKIADFGMAVFVGRDFSRVLTTFRGTAGYLAPEWLSGVAITPKVDVYSYGMVLLEIVSGRRNTPEAYNSSNYQATCFPVQAMSKIHEGDVQSLVDPRLHGDFDLEEAERLCKVAFWCIQDDESDRPTMGEVVRVLEGLQEVDMPPMPRLLAAITVRPNVG